MGLLGLWKLFRDQAQRHSGIGLKLSASSRNRCSPSPRNPVRVHPGTAFGFDRIPHRQETHARAESARRSLRPARAPTKNATSPITVHMGIILIWKPIVVSFGRQQIEQPATARAGKHATCQPVRGVPESARSPNAPNVPRGVHRSPRGLVLSLLFLVEMPVSD